MTLWKNNDLIIKSILEDGIDFLFKGIEVESSVNIIHDSKVIKFIDQRIIHDEKTAKTYIIFRFGNSKPIRIKVDKIIDFLMETLKNASMEGDDSIVKIMARFLEHIPKIECDTQSKNKKNSKEKPIVKSSEKNGELTVQEIIDSDIDNLDKVKQLISFSEGRSFIKKMANTDSDKIIDTINRMVKTSFGQTMIRKIIERHMNLKHTK